MANVLPLAPATAPPAEFVEALNGLIVGIVSLDFVRQSLTAALAADRRSAAIVQALMDDAYQDGRLGAEEYEILTGDVGLPLGEDVPTEWSDEVVNEAAPASDTASPGDRSAQASAIRPAALFPGAVLAHRYVLQARLQTGGMSEVYKALDRRLQEAGAANPWLAIKLVNPAHPRFPEALRLLEREAAIARELDHPHIARAQGFERDSGHAFITMEWLDGESLADLLTRQRFRPLTVARARQIMGEIAGALAFAHARGITHADVKPGNIFLLRDGGAKLLDFGIARSATAAADQTIAGARTPAYASCEVLEGLSATAQDDVYALAAVAYRMFAGRRVFGHQDALAAEAAGRRPAPIRGLSARQWAALARALSFRRAVRTPDVATFLEAFNETAPVARAAPAATARVAPAATARVASIETRSSSGKGRRWAGVAAALLATAAVIWLWPATDAPQDSVARTAIPVPEPATQTAAAAGTAPPAMAVPTQPPTKRKTQSTNRASTEAPRNRPALPPAAAARHPPPPPPVGVAKNAPVAPEGVAVAAQDVLANSTPLLPAAVVVASTPAEPAEVPLSALKFRRYVEPRDSRRPVDVPGWVELAFTVGTDGRTRDIRIVGASPTDRYEGITLDAVRRWRFEPALEDGHAVERRTDVRIRFQPK